jgi:hypothetical protein
MLRGPTLIKRAVMSEGAACELHCGMLLCKSPIHAQPFIRIGHKEAQDVTFAEMVPPASQQTPSLLRLSQLGQEVYCAPAEFTSRRSLANVVS